MIELFNQYENIKNENETELVFIDSLLREPNYKEQIKRINNNKALPILNHRNGSEYYFNADRNIRGWEINLGRKEPSPDII
ncbi:hypothetical protein [Vibrio cholerae]|uniref:hypothetical protein n=1 Tax=Vibrio cholerae TaxID=666 RepID=UPI0013C33007|nr:hypothetical protein [Vibrio cholerae]